MVMVAINLHADNIAINLIAASQPTGYAVGMRIISPDAYIQVIFIENNGKFGLLGRGLPLRWFMLDKITSTVRIQPHRFIQPTINMRRTIRQSGGMVNFFGVLVFLGWQRERHNQQENNKKV